MSIRTHAMLAGAAAILATAYFAPVHALTIQECSVKYKDAQSAGTLKKGMKWNDFRKAECGADATAAKKPAKTTEKAKPAKAEVTPEKTAAKTGEPGALSMKECSALYQSAKDAGELDGRKWPEFRKTECSAEAAKTLQTGRAVSAPSSSGNAVFPTVVAPKYSTESAGKARMHTCLDQYKANKANNSNGGLRWIEKGGGYYSECNRRLKGAPKG